MNTATESETNASAPEVPQPKTKRTHAKRAKPAKKALRAKKPADYPKRPIASFTKAREKSLAIIKPKQFL